MSTDHPISNTVDDPTRGMSYRQKAQYYLELKLRLSILDAAGETSAPIPLTQRLDACEHLIDFFTKKADEQENPAG